MDKFFIVEDEIFFAFGAFLLIFIAPIALRKRRKACDRSGAPNPTVASSINDFARDQTGVSYCLAFTLLLPLYVFTMCFTLELTYLMATKIGCARAAFMAARAATVHTTVERPEDREDGSTSSASKSSGGEEDEEDDPFITSRAKKKAKRAAIISMTPYSGGFDSVRTSESKEAQEFLKAYKEHVAALGMKPYARDSYISARFACAERRTTVKLSVEKDETFKRQTEEDQSLEKQRPWRQSVRAIVTYKMPFRFPLVGRCLGGKSDDGAVVREMSCEAVALLECPKNPTGSLGVPVPAEKIEKDQNEEK